MEVAIPSAILGAMIALILILAGECLLEYLSRKTPKIKKWWESGKWHPPESLEYLSISGEKKSGKPMYVYGFHIVVARKPNGREMVGAGQAVDRDEFWKTWKYLGGQSSGWVDEEGNEFDPTNP